MRSLANRRRPRLISFKIALYGLLVGLLPHTSIVTPADAASVEFSANVTPANACSIFVRRDGDLGLSGDKMVLSSKLVGGRSGIADVFSSGAFDLYAETSGYFSSSPALGNLNTVVQSLFSGIDVFRGRTFAEQDGSIPVRLRNGISITRVNINLIGTRTGSEFPGGDYTGTVVVRCE